MTTQIERSIDEKKRISNQKITVKRGVRQNFPGAIERQYRRELNQMVSRMIELTRINIYPELPIIEAEASFRRPVLDSERMDDYSDSIEQVIDSTKSQLANDFPDIVLETGTAAIATQTSDFNRVQVKKVIKGMVGVDVFFDEPWLNQEVNAFIKTNVDLIKTVPERYFDQIEGIILRGNVQGLRHEVIRSQIISRYSVARNNAARIARDQINKLNGQLTELRQTSVGVKGYTWITAGDERVRGNPSGKFPNARPSHFDRDGKMFKWSKPPVDGHPGFPIQCRCWAQPKLQEFL